MKKQRKFLLVVPLLVLPFLTLAFWALGGGKRKSDSQVAVAKGLDTSLPQAQFKDKRPEDKMGVYQQSRKDSGSTDQSGISQAFAKSMGLAVRRDSATKRSSPSADESTTKIQAKLAEINRQISQPQKTTYSRDENQADPEVRKLNRMMKSMNKGQGNDPEMQQLNQMLAKIQAIQHPELVKKPKKKPNADSAFRAIPAVIDGNQRVVNGGIVRLKLTDSVVIKGVRLPIGQELNGACEVTNQRLLLTIQNIRIGKDILPANLTVFSLDGMPGIPAPEAELQGAAGNGADNALQNMQLISMDQSLGAQAAAGGVNAAKGFFSKKVKTIKVRLKADFPVLLKVNN
jgi:hypothetical protein